MSTLQPLLIPLGLILVVASVAAAAAVVRLVRARRRAKLRVREEPNSHYTSHLVIQRDTRVRWHDIDVARLHEINRQEVVRLLATADALGVDGLRPAERIFLDRMAEVAASDSTPDRPGGRSGRTPSSLQLSPRV